MEDFIKNYGSVTLAGLGAAIVIGGIIAALKSGVGDIIVDYLICMI